MKMARQNKYNNKKAIGLAMILASGILLSGCNSTNKEVIEPTEIEIIEAVETPIPTIKPTPIPTATPIPEPTPEPNLYKTMSLNDKLILLGVKDGNQLIRTASIFVIEYTINDTNKVAFNCIKVFADENNNAVLFDSFSGENTFLITSNINDIPIGEIDVSSIIPNNERLKDAKVVKMYVTPYLPEEAKISVEYLSEETRKNLSLISPSNKDSYFVNNITYSQLATLYFEIFGNKVVLFEDLTPINLEEEKVLVK